MLSNLCDLYFSSDKQNMNNEAVPYISCGVIKLRENKLMEKWFIFFLGGNSVFVAIFVEQNSINLGDCWKIFSFTLCLCVWLSGVAQQFDKYFNVFKLHWWMRLLAPNAYWHFKCCIDGWCSMNVPNLCQNIIFLISFSKFAAIFWPFL